MKPGGPEGLSDKVLLAIDALEEAVHGHARWTYTDTESMVLPAMIGGARAQLYKAILAEVAALREVEEAARLMPRRTPGPGGSSTQHSFPIEAGVVWRLDLALTALDKVREGS